MKTFLSWVLNAFGSKGEGLSPVWVEEVKRQHDEKMKGLARKNLPQLERIESIEIRTIVPYSSTLLEMISAEMSFGNTAGVDALKSPKIRSWHQDMMVVDIVDGYDHRWVVLFYDDDSDFGEMRFLCGYRAHLKIVVG